MTRLGSEKRPVIVRVKTEARAHAITAVCTMRGRQCIAASSRISRKIFPTSSG